MSMDLFTTQGPVDTLQDTYRECLMHQWNKDCAYLRSKRILPPWIEADMALEADEHKVLSYIYDTAGHAYYGGSHDASKQLADALGFLATGNLEAVIKKCLDRKLITIKTEYYADENGRADKSRLCMEEYGAWMLELMDE